MKPPTALLAILLAACEPPQYEPHGGPLYANSCPLVYWCHNPGRIEFYALPGCDGEPTDGLFVRSVKIDGVCVDEEGP